MIPWIIYLIVMTLIIIGFLKINNEDSIFSHLKNRENVVFLFFYMFFIFIVVREYTLFYLIKGDIIKNITVSNIKQVEVIKFDMNLNDGKFFKQEVLKTFNKSDEIKNIVNIFREVKMEKPADGRGAGKNPKTFYLLIIFETQKGKRLSYLIEKPNFTYFIYYEPVEVLYNGELIKVNRPSYSPPMTSTGLLRFYQSMEYTSAGFY